MSRTLGTGLATHLATGRTKLSRCLRLDLLDGTSLGITDHDQDISINLGDGLLTYEASTGIVPSAVSLSVGLDADNLEARGPISSLVPAAAILGGRFDQAVARLFDVKWDSPAVFMRLLKGNVSQARIEAGEFVLELRGFQDKFNQPIGRVLSPVCTHDLGDAKCQVDLTPFTFPATVTAVSDDTLFSVSYTGATPAAGQLLFGTCEFLTGVLAGTHKIEVFDHSGPAIRLYMPLAQVPEVGDTLRLVAGCDKLRATCRDTYANAVNFGGFPDGPGSSAYLKYPIPGTTA